MAKRKPKVDPYVKAMKKLADQYFAEQCERLGPPPIAPECPSHEASLYNHAMDVVINDMLSDMRSKLARPFSWDAFALDYKS